MTREELKKYSYNKIKELNELLSVESPELEFYESFFREGQFNNKKRLLNLTFSKLLIAFLGTTEVCEDFDHMKLDCISISQALNEVSFEELHIALEEIEDYINKTPRQERMKKKLFSKKNNGEKEIFDYLVRFNKNFFSQSRLELTAKYINEYEHAMIDALFVAAPANMFEKIKKDIDKKLPDNIPEKEREKRLLNMISDKVNFKAFDKCMMMMKAHYAKLQNKKNENIKSIQKDIRGYEKVIREIDELFSVEEITDYKSFIKNITDENVRRDILKLVYNHNKEYYEKLTREHKMINEDTKLHYYALLEKYNIEKGDVDIYQIMQQEYEDFAESIKELNKINNNKDFIIKGLQESNLERIKEIVNLKEKGIIEPDKIYENADILELDSEKYKKINNSINTISDKGINPSIFGKEIEILINDETLKTNLNIIEDNNYIQQLKNTEKHDFLLNDNLKEKIDLLYELNINKFAKDDLDILNEENYDRIRVLNEIDYKIETKEELVDILRNDNFPIPDNKIKDYISKTK